MCCEPGIPVVLDNLRNNKEEEDKLEADLICSK
jgi:hypothetical protein